MRPVSRSKVRDINKQGKVVGERAIIEKENDWGFIGHMSAKILRFTQIYSDLLRFGPIWSDEWGW